MANGTGQILNSAALEQRRESARQIWLAGVEAVRPESCVPQTLRSMEVSWDAFERVLVVGGGKAGAAMAAATEATLLELAVPEQAVAGWLNVPAETAAELQQLHLHPARPHGMNEPTAEAVAGTEEILRLVGDAPPRTLLLCLISGGGSALLCAPATGLSLADKQLVTRCLSRCGATIGEMNCVRKHLSRIKGGGLAQAFLANPEPRRRLLTLVISDVLGDPLDVIASGPTVPDPTTFADALGILRKYDLESIVPPNALTHLRAGAAGFLPETCKHADTRASTIVVANGQRARTAAVQAATARGYCVQDWGDLAGDTLLAAQGMAARLRLLHEQGSERPWCIISGGETTMVLPPAPGKGGRNQSFALALGLGLEPDVLADMTILCAGTDGEDGPTDAAGAFYDALTTRRAQGLESRRFLDSCDGYAFFAATGSLFKPGLTRTNVMDLRIILAEFSAKPEKERFG